MRRLVMILVVLYLLACAFDTGWSEGAVEGYMSGVEDGERVGILTCPCWSRQ